MGHFDDSKDIMEPVFNHNGTVYDMGYSKHYGKMFEAMVSCNGVDYISPPDGACFWHAVSLMCYPEVGDYEACDRLKGMMEIRMV